mgnify:CR=1 FL=1
MTEIKQVPDDIELLNLMLEDSKSAPKFYQSTNFWENYIDEFLPELKTLGLHDFRRRSNSILSSFSAIDVLQSSRYVRSLHKGRGSIKRRLFHFLLSIIYIFLYNLLTL